MENFKLNTLGKILVAVVIIIIAWNLGGSDEAGSSSHTPKKEKTPSENMIDILKDPSNEVYITLRREVEKYFNYPETISYENGVIGEIVNKDFQTKEVYTVYLVTADNAFGTPERYRVAIHFRLNGQRAPSILESKARKGWSD